jgi:hypothetical protein
MLTFLVLAGTALGSVQAQGALDDESCLACHQRVGLAAAAVATDEVQHFEIDSDSWFQTVHGAVACRDCHRDVTQLPHGPIEAVNCAMTCHIADPSTGRPFSHRGMQERLARSVHGVVAEHGPHASDLPTCRSCHVNDLHDPMVGAWGATQAMVNETTTRCQDCHLDPAWADRVLTHVTHRMRRRRSPEEVVILCTSCHEDADRMGRHGLLPVWDYRDSYHWRMVLLGDPNAPDCLSCHVPVGFSAHEIYPGSDGRSAINMENRQQTCGNQGGAQSCHPGASRSFAEAQVHFTDRGTLAVLDDEMVDSEVRSRLQERLASERGVSGADLFRLRLLKLISGFYKILIGLVAGGMIVHQTLDFFAQRRLLRQHAASTPAPEAHDG